MNRWFQDYRPSLRRWTRGFALAWLVSAVLVGSVAVRLLDQIYNDARTTYTREIPNLLDRNRNAVKLERLSSFLRTITFALDPREQRRTLVQLQTLAQGFDLDDDARLSQGAALVVANARKIVAIRAKPRPTTAPAGEAGPGDPAAPGEAERQTQRLSAEALQALASLTDYVTTDAALTADRMASRIQANAAKVKYGCLAALAFFIAFGLFLLWFFRAHVLGPIAAAVKGLEAVSASTTVDVALAPTRFFELDMIRRSVVEHARFASDLRAANATLRTLSSQDGLTGLSNRRSFDAALAHACRGAAGLSRGFALLLIDIDHFKLLNDRHGHLVGDQCLRQVGMTLQGLCAPRGDEAARYGGEEFGVIVSDVSPDQAGEVAEAIRAAVASRPCHVADPRLNIDMTVSIGVTHVPSDGATAPHQVIREADQALYRAKHSGRNVVRMFGIDEIPLAKAS